MAMRALTRDPTPKRVSFEPPCRALSILVPLAVSLPHLAGEARFDGDLALLRGMALLGHGFTGAASAWLVHASFWLPLGTPAYRGALSAAVLLACASLALFELARAVLLTNASGPRLSPMLALIASLTVSLSASAQREGELAGGGALAFALSVFVLANLVRGPPLHAQRAAVTGMALGALLAEGWTCFVVLIAALSVGYRVGRLRPTPRIVACSAIAATVVVALLWSALIIRPWAAHPYAELAGPSSFARQTGASGVRVLHTDMGWLASFAAVAGGALGLWRPVVRPAASCLLFIVVVDALSTWLPSRVLGDLTALHLLAFAASAVAIAVAVQSAAVALARFQLPMTRGAAVFLVMADLTLAVALAEEAAFGRNDAVARATAAVTNEAIVRLPEGTALLVRSPELIRRVLVARVVEHQRPDVLLLAWPVLSEPRFAAALLEKEPSLQQLLRDNVLEGHPREGALTVVADARPLMCELDREWDRRTLSHLVPEGLWLRFAPQPLGASDRRTAYAGLAALTDRVAAQSRQDDKVEATAAGFLRARLVDAATLAAALGDRDEVPGLLQAIDGLSSGASSDLFVRELTARMSGNKGAVDWKTLPR